MNPKTRRKLELGARALEFTRAHRETCTTSRDLPELRQKFNLRRSARSMIAEAQTPGRGIAVHPAVESSPGLDDLPPAA